jgi:hypothetical protein
MPGLLWQTPSSYLIATKERLAALYLAWCDELDRRDGQDEASIRPQREAIEGKQRELREAMRGRLAAWARRESGRWGER